MIRPMRLGAGESALLKFECKTGASTQAAEWLQLAPRHGVVYSFRDITKASRKAWRRAQPIERMLERKGAFRSRRFRFEIRKATEDMSTSGQSRAVGRLAGLAPAAQWGLLLVGSAAAALILVWRALPAALLLGPMIAGILVGTNGGAIRVARLVYY